MKICVGFALLMLIPIVMGLEDITPNEIIAGNATSINETHASSVSRLFIATADVSENEEMIVKLLVNSLAADKQVAYVDADVLYNNDIKVWIYPKIADENNTFDIMTKTCLAYIELQGVFPEIQDLLIEVDIPLSDRPIFSLGTANCLKEWTYGTKSTDGTWNVDSLAALMKKVCSSGRHRAYDLSVNTSRTKEETELKEMTCTFNMDFPNIGHIPTDYYMGPYSTGKMGVSITVFGDVVPSSEISLAFGDNLTKFLVEITNSLKIPYIAIREDYSPVSKIHGVILLRRIYKNGEYSKGDITLDIDGTIDAIKTKATQDGYTCEVRNNESSMIILKCTNHSTEPDIFYFIKQVNLMYDKLYEYGYLKLEKFGQKEAYITLSTLTINESTYDLHQCHKSTQSQPPKNEELNAKREFDELSLPNLKDQYFEILSSILNASEEEYYGYQDSRYIENTVLKFEILDDPRTIDLLIHALRNNTDRGGSYLNDIIDTLINIGISAVDPLIQVLLDENTEPLRRSLAAEALGEIADPRAIDPLIQNLKRKDSELDTITVALGRIGDAAVDPLILALKDDDPKVRGDVAYILGYLGNERAIDPLKELLNDKDLNVRDASAEALETFGSQ